MSNLSHLAMETRRRGEEDRKEEEEREEEEEVGEDQTKVCFCLEIMGLEIMGILES